jgi:diacylglycerol kinase family enzyme
VTRLLLVTNADAGSADQAAVDSALDVLRGRAEVEVRRTADVDDLDRILSGLTRRPASDRPTLVLAGGDGTMHLAANRLHALGALSDVVLGLIPLGTGNDLARGVGIPLDPEAAAEVVLAGRERGIDVLLDEDGGVVVNAVHVGVGADAARAARPWKRLGKVGYVVGAVIAGLTSDGLHLRVEADALTLADGRRRVLQVGVSNGPDIGGGTELAPRADPGDGRADVTVSYAVGRLDRLRYGLRLRRGTHEERHDVQTARATKVVVSGDEFWCNTDGELAGPMRSRTWTVEPAALRLITSRQVSSG